MSAISQVQAGAALKRSGCSSQVDAGRLTNCCAQPVKLTTATIAPATHARAGIIRRSPPACSGTRRRQNRRTSRIDQLHIGSATRTPARPPSLGHGTSARADAGTSIVTRKTTIYTTTAAGSAARRPNRSTRGQCTGAYRSRPLGRPRGAPHALRQWILALRPRLPPSPPECVGHDGANSGARMPPIKNR